MTKTRERIIKMAVRLFNRHGIGEVSTKRIAKSMGISPGNLHYHFRSKEDLVRAIWAIMEERLDAVWSDPAIAASEAAVAGFLRGLNTIFYEFRFFYLQLPMLVERDPVIGQRYAKRARRALERFREFTDAWMAAGIMRKLESEEERTLLIRNMWLVSQLWMYYWHTVCSGVKEKDIHEGMLQTLALYTPYLSEKSGKKIWKLVNRM
jgi:AcrR family transcriptional regulator